MSQNKMFTRLMLVLSMICFIAFTSPIAIQATGLDGLGSQTQSGSTESNGSSSGSDDSAMSDYLSGYNAVSSDNMSAASTLATPIANAIGTITGFIMIIVSAGIFLITALDLAYIGLPFLRPMLNPQAGAGAGGGMGAMGGGFGGSPMGGMGGGAQPQGRKWISDEAEACVAQAGGGGAQGGGMMPGGGGFGGGGFGSPMGGMGGGAQPQPTKSVILMYLKKRAFFLIIFAVASIVLMSSIFTDCGINLAALLTKIMNKFNNTLGNVNV
jgi:hypothetical protein